MTFEHLLILSLILMLGVLVYDRIRAHTVKEDPLAPVLDTLLAQFNELRENAEKSQGTLERHLNQMIHEQRQLKQETSNLTNALRAPHIRGRWGEIQLKRVVEMAGMIEYCDFLTQESSIVNERRSRPDMVIKLPNERKIVVDAKVPLQAFLDSLEAKEEKSRKESLLQHAKQLRAHIVDLSLKSYWDQFSSAPDFVILFLPGESIFSAALEQDPSLIEMGVEKKILIATPTSLIALLRSCAWGWNQEKMAKNAKEVFEIGKELHKRLLTLTDHFESIRRGLETTISAYNKSVASFETRVLVQAKKMREKGGFHETDFPDLNEVALNPKSLNLVVEEPLLKE